MAADQGERRSRARAERGGHSRGAAALGRERALHPRDCRGQGTQARVALKPQRPADNVKAGATRQRQLRPGAERALGEASRRAPACSHELATRQNKQASRKELERVGKAAAAIAGIRAAVPCDLARRGAERGRMGARDQVRRLSHPGSSRSWQRAASHAQGARLDGEISQRRGGGEEASRAHAR